MRANEYDPDCRRGPRRTLTPKTSSDKGFRKRATPGSLPSVDTQNRPLGWRPKTLTAAGNSCSYAGMSNILGDERHQQIRALGLLEWTLRRIEQATTVRRETASAYLKAAGIPVRGRGRPGVGPPKPAISGEVSTDLGTAPEPPIPGRAPSAL